MAVYMRGLLSWLLPAGVALERLVRQRASLAKPYLVILAARRRDDGATSCPGPLLLVQRLSAVAAADHEPPGWAAEARPYSGVGPSVDVRALVRFARVWRSEKRLRERRGGGVSGSTLDTREDATREAVPVSALEAVLYFFLLINYNVNYLELEHQFKIWLLEDFSDHLKRSCGKNRYNLISMY